MIFLTEENEVVTDSENQIVKTSDVYIQGVCVIQL